jgi:hypothetical protein
MARSLSPLAHMEHVFAGAKSSAYLSNGHVARAKPSIFGQFKNDATCRAAPFERCALSRVDLSENPSQRHPLCMSRSQRQAHVRTPACTLVDRSNCLQSSGCHLASIRALDDWPSSSQPTTSTNGIQRKPVAYAAFILEGISAKSL